MIDATGRKHGKQYSSLFAKRKTHRPTIDPQVAEQRIAARLARLGF